MRRSVWKYVLSDTLTKLDMPYDAAPLCVEQRPEGMCLWAEVWPDRDTEVRTFAVVGTGREVPDGAEYFGTAFDGFFVWHVYEVIA